MARYVLENNLTASASVEFINKVSIFFFALGDFVFNFGRWSTILSAERYVASDNFASFSVNRPSAALVKFNRFSVGLEYIF